MRNAKCAIYICEVKKNLVTLAIVPNNVNISPVPSPEPPRNFRGGSGLGQSQVRLK